MRQWGNEAMGMPIRLGVICQKRGSGGLLPRSQWPSVRGCREKLSGDFRQFLHLVRQFGKWREDGVVL